ncbi:D-2-hydroxyglutarate dehydrogenase-like protein [Dinothrombium tinctorium]|uniref:D-2-hydroxyglutarate dehydrogenase, mitochondrial n=1 Tax=Dinothrombium tinctorium TaxID=1965070 RepID=A0A3S3PX25_9ACAR|nr:D-2-hydroxyglutarate dehydrogenase-like protein [Dinothrombium tinctorium]
MNILRNLLKTNANRNVFALKAIEKRNHYNDVNNKEYLPFEKKKYERRHGYTPHYHTKGLLPRVKDDSVLPLCSIPQRKKPDPWNKREAIFGQNDYIDILGDGEIKPHMILKNVPFWLRGFRGNEMKTLQRKVAIFRHFRWLRPQKLRCFNRSRFYAIFSRNYNKLVRDDVEHFVKTLGENSVKTDDLDSYNEDWLSVHKGRSSLVLFPKSTLDVSRILSYCSTRELPLVVQGGKTSLVAGSVPISDEIILCMSKMNKIESFDDTSGILQCQSGCILQNLEEFVGQHQYIMPYDLGAKGSCQIGGNVATNAAGLRFIRYGSLHQNVLGLEVVGANGTVLNLMSSMRKDNTGYDLKQLFIGSEGTLGVITKVIILCPPKPQYKVVMLLSLNSFKCLLSILKEAKSKLGEFISAFEMIDFESMNVVVDNLKLTPPFEANIYALIELSANDSNLLEAQLTNFVEEGIADGIIKDGTYSSDIHVMNKLWALREGIPEALLKDGYCYKYDVSLPLNHYYELVELMREKLRSTKAVRVCSFGHVGDFNLHFNVTSKQFEPDVLRLIEPQIYEWISDRGGSISAEHGLGQRKNNYIHLSKSREAIEIMFSLKKLFDPKLILNPGKMLPDWKKA